MKVLIVCQSVHHGNTAKIATAIAEELGATVLKPSEVDAGGIGEYDLIGLGSGIYHHSHHKALLDMADWLPDANKPVFIFSTRGYARPLPARREDHLKLREKLAMKGYSVMGEFSCRGWSTFYGPTRLFGGINRNCPGARELADARQFARSLDIRLRSPTRNVDIIDAGVSAFSHAYILKGKKAVIVDTGVAGQAGKILDTLEKNGIRKNEVSLILLTHGHWDHYGNALELKEALGVPIAMGKADASHLARGMDAPIRPASLQGHIFKLFLRSRPKALKADIVIEGETDLSEYGVDAVAFPTPGHTFGSLSVMAGDGCLIGDLLMRMPPFGRTAGFPSYAECREMVGPSLKRVLDKGPRTIYPTHGEPCDAATVRKKMAYILR